MGKSYWKCETKRFQAPQIRDALLELEEISEDSKIKSEAKCLATYELENFNHIS